MVLRHGNTRPLLVIASGVTWDGVKGSERHLAEALLRYADVLWVDPPVSPATPQRYRGAAARGRSWRSRLRTVEPGLFRLTPVVLPGLSRPLVRDTTWPLVRSQARRAVRRLGRRPAAVLSCSLDDMARGWPAGTRRVLYGTDDWCSGGALVGQPAARLRRQEARMLAAADLVLAVTPELADRWRRPGTDPVVLPNGCDPAAYLDVDQAEPATLPAGFPTRVAGVLGQFNERTELGLLEAVAASGIGLLLVGPHDPGWQPKRWAALLAQPNVWHTGAVPFDELSGWLRHVDVGLTAYADTPFNRASFPLKTLEYLAAGRPVVGSGLPATRRLAAECPDVWAVPDPRWFVTTVLAVAAVPPSEEALDRRRAMAARQSWAARADVLAELLDLPRSTNFLATTGIAGPILPAGEPSPDANHKARRTR